MIERLDRVVRASEEVAEARGDDVEDVGGSFSVGEGRLESRLFDREDRVSGRENRRWTTTSDDFCHAGNDSCAAAQSTERVENVASCAIRVLERGTGCSVIMKRR